MAAIRAARMVVTALRIAIATPHFEFDLARRADYESRRAAASNDLTRNKYKQGIQTIPTI